MRDPIYSIFFTILEDILYWVDAKQNTVEAMSLDGKSRRLVVEESDAHYFGITLNGNHLLISDWKTKYNYIVL